MSKLTRRSFFGSAMAGAAALSGCATGTGGEKSSARRPNIVLIMTDDQGYGDMACHGNEVISTPNIDRLHGESTRLTQFHVMPVCSPTRACLMTGRYNYRTGVVDTYLGRSMMRPDETTMAELFRASGYRTGIFGKWHLGDNYPLRATEQGFEESLVHNGGGMAQPSEPPDSGYFDPLLLHNGEWERHAGYCTDIFASAAIDYIRAHKTEPFFVYLPTNAPHTPLEVPDDYAAPYRDKGLDEQLAKLYGMITNFDDNLGRVLDTLDEEGLAQNTIVIFLTDNGAQRLNDAPRYNAGMRGWKGSVYQGGIRVPCFMRWPEQLEAGKEVDEIAAHIDLLPTLLDLCGVSTPAGTDKPLDGLSLTPLLGAHPVPWRDRALFFQWHRGDEPEPYNSCAVRTQRWKLVNGEELYDMANDPGEETNVAAAHPEEVTQLRSLYDTWFKSVSANGYAPPRIYIGTEHENPVILTRQDWRGTDGWNDDRTGHWEVFVASEGRYDITVDLPEGGAAGTLHLTFGELALTASASAGMTSHTFAGAALPEGDARLRAWLDIDGKERGARYVRVKRL